MFIFYNQLKSDNGAVEHTGDNRTGEGDGDDEVVKVNLTQVPADVDKIVVTVTIHDAAARGQNFGQVANAFIRVVNEETGTEVVRFDLAEDYSVETAIIVGEVYRHNGEWKFRAVGQRLFRWSTSNVSAVWRQYLILDPTGFSTLLVVNILPMGADQCKAQIVAKQSQFSIAKRSIMLYVPFKNYA